MTKDEAKALYESDWWVGVSDRDIAMFQLHERLLCLPFGRFHEAVEKALGRPVYTHEFATPELLRRELRGDKEPPSFEEILNLIPAEKRIILVT